MNQRATALPRPLADKKPYGGLIWARRSCIYTLDMAVILGPRSATDAQYMQRNITFKRSHMELSMERPVNRLPFDRDYPHPPSRSNPSLKHFAADLAFLCQGPLDYDLEGHSVIMVGTTGGLHYDTLAAMYPDVDFHLYHPKQGIVTAPNITHQGKVFSDAEAAKWAAKNMPLVFICDVRVIETAGDVETLATMEAQKRWLHILKPNQWSVTFRMPFSLVMPGKPYTYLAGRLTFMPFCKPMMPELRLDGWRAQTLPGAPLVQWDTKKIEQAAFYHNVVIRPNEQLFANQFPAPGAAPISGPRLGSQRYADPIFNHGYDMSYLLYTLIKYSRTQIAVTHPKTETEVLAYAKALMTSIAHHM